jgi:hypothetical protein
MLPRNLQRFKLQLERAIADGRRTSLNSRALLADLVLIEHLLDEELLKNGLSAVPGRVVRSVGRRPLLPRADIGVGPKRRCSTCGRPF